MTVEGKGNIAKIYKFLSLLDEIVEHEGQNTNQDTRVDKKSNKKK